MSHLLAISVGPVQELIAAARRTRDLWLGSLLLSEVSRAAAIAVKAAEGELIFPACSAAESVANLILAELGDADPRETADRAREAARARWAKFADEAFREAAGVIDRSIWDEQVEDVIEFYAAWVSRTPDYRADRAKVMRLLAGRKNCRDFLPARGRAGVPKSSLDGQRESVLRPAKERPDLPARLRIRPGEQLDVVGLVKRAAGGKQAYPSVARIAADPWVRGNRDRLGQVQEECRKLGDSIVRRLDGYPQYASFPYDGTPIYVNRHRELLEDAGVTAEAQERRAAELRPLREAVSRVGPEPESYLAVLVADGDRMGAAISALASPDEHRAFSETLSKFAVAARTIVEAHRGVLVYAGGDDVLALLPADQCLACARELHDDFGTRLAGYGHPTLSVGIAIAHFLEDLEDLLNFGRAAEKAAKRVEGKDALAVYLHKRSGAPIQVAAHWQDEPDARLTRFANWMNEAVLPTGLPYELRLLAHHYEGWNGSVESAIEQDLYRLIARKASSNPEGLRRALSRDLQGLNPERLTTLAQELLVARQLAGALRQASGRPKAAAEAEG